MFFEFMVLSLFGNVFVACIKPASICCPKVSTVKNFNAHRYIGKWYDQRTLRPKDDNRGKCLIMEYNLDENDSLTLSYSGLSRFDDPPILGNATSRIPDLAEPAKFKLRHSSDPEHESDYWILGTDYESYTLTYGCDDSDGNCNLYATILTREINPSKSIIDEALGVAKKNNLNTSWFNRTEPILCDTKFIESRFGGLNDELDNQLDFSSSFFDSSSSSFESFREGKESGAEEEEDYYY